jgi:hypothetical protein
MADAFDCSPAEFSWPAWQPSHLFRQFFPTASEQFAYHFRSAAPQSP